MEVVSLPRQGGKTHRMLSWLMGDEGRYLVVMFEQERDRLRHLLLEQLADETVARVTGLRIFTSFDIIVGRHRGSQIKEVSFDNLDLILTNLVGAPVRYATITEDPPVGSARWVAQQPGYLTPPRSPERDQETLDQLAELGISFPNRLEGISEPREDPKDPEAVSEDHPARKALIERLLGASINDGGTPTEARPERQAPDKDDPQRLRRPMISRGPCD